MTQIMIKDASPIWGIGSPDGTERGVLLSVQELPYKAVR